MYIYIYIYLQLVLPHLSTLNRKSKIPNTLIHPPNPTTPPPPPPSTCRRHSRFIYLFRERELFFENLRVPRKALRYLNQKSFLEDFINFWR